MRELMNFYVVSALGQAGDEDRQKINILRGSENHHQIMNIYEQRIDALRAIMAQKGWDAVLVSGSDSHSSEYVAPRYHQPRWLTGYDGEGEIVVTADHAGLWTDTRYFIQAERQLPGTGVSLHKTRVPEQVLIPQWLASEFPVSAVIAVDGLASSKADVDEISAAMNDVRIVNEPDLLSSLWADRPEIPCTPIITLGTDLTGESRAERIEWLRDFIAEKGCDAVLLTALDEIAWLLNVRGADVQYNPVVISYLLVSADEVCWYVRKKGSLDDETVASFEELRAEGVEIYAYDDVVPALSSLVFEGTRSIYTDPATLNYSLGSVLDLSGMKVIYGQSPVPLRKAVKNAVEIDGMREAHVEDGLAMERFLYWLDKQMEMDAPVSEWDASCKLHELRAEIPGFRGESFETISAYEENAALPHYITPEHGSALLEPRGLYLNDSGGQYLFGTTDITRTVPLGPCSELEKEDYTLVLKGHIGLARALFPKGTAGCQIDILARDPLWKSKRNFGHGTGHGVGFFLNVHEGPQDIRQNFNSTPLLPGMISSNEPGIYREGRHGIRHENLVLCVEDGSNDFGSWLRFETLTLCHFDTSAIKKNLLSQDEIEWLNAYNAHVYDVLAPRLSSEVAKWLRSKTQMI